MLNFLTEQLDKLAEISERHLADTPSESDDILLVHTPNKDVPAGIVPLGVDQYLVVCGFLGNPSQIKLPKRSLPTCTPDGLEQWVQKTHGQNASVLVWNLSGVSYPTAIRYKTRKHNKDEDGHVAIERDVESTSTVPKEVKGSKPNDHHHPEIKHQVLEYPFPGLPCPPLPMLAEVARSVYSWIKMNDCTGSSSDVITHVQGNNGDKNVNVAVLHDISGRRCVVVAACVLAMMQADERKKKEVETELQLQSSTKLPQASRAQVAALRLKQDTFLYEAVVYALGRVGKIGMMPSQLRYFNYHSQMYRKDPTYQIGRGLILQRMIVNGIPDFNNARPTDRINENSVACRPLLKIFDCHGMVIAMTSDSGVTYRAIDGSFLLVPTGTIEETEIITGPGNASTTPAVLVGDIIIKVYHHANEVEEKVEKKVETNLELHPKGEVVPVADSNEGRKTKSEKRGRRSGLLPMFSAMLCVDFISTNVVRLNRSELDGASNDSRFPRNFFIDIVLVPASQKQTEVALALVDAHDTRPTA